MNKKGFTLIELLVVIAIIGILSGIVLTSLGSAREKARDASAQASMTAMRAEAELAVNAAGSYPSDLCTSQLADLIDAVESQAGTVDCDPASDGSGWAASVQLNNGNFFCVDSTGVATTTSAALKGENDTACS